ncbi:glutamine synthetase family protein [Sphingobium sp. HBC34]|uniref:Glutamine synthetase family protein n=1 Tax=Sphingobium cyanobacteriorum TaxID=3063954 RepID=A0ABT8ZUH8_9SPHN|nr:glutamine synthetase family protein [Sphingobium sp. HBC34]MDO7837385.1 glutamine synthetase family protein [Sphingobium sp. HBC34]
MHNFEKWIQDNNIAEVECLVPDINGVLRGKVLPAQKFIKSERAGTLRMPSSIFTVTITGDYAGEDERAYQDPDLLIQPDLSTLRVAPGFKTPTAYVFANACLPDGTRWEASPRNILMRIIDLYATRGWTAVVAPELEFYLTTINTDPDLPLVPPPGRSGRAETSPQPYGLESLTEYEDLIEAIYEDSEIASLHLDTMIHESGTAQLEINFHHGDPLALADQVLVFKRIVRQTALRHGVYATFMAKPMAEQPGSAMHLHMSMIDSNGVNQFSDTDGRDTELFRHFVGGLQAYLPEMAPLFGPTVNSFRRMLPDHSAPINVQWGVDNRSCGLRVPIDDAQNRRIENRLPGADANPYLAIAATLIAGWLGIQDRIEPDELVTGNAYHYARTLPRTLEHAMERLALCTPVRNLLGDTFLEAFSAIKSAEIDNFQGVISSWERDHLLLKA